MTIHFALESSIKIAVVYHIPDKVKRLLQQKKALSIAFQISYRQKTGSIKGSEILSVPSALLLLSL